MYLCFLGWCFVSQTFRENKNDYRSFAKLWAGSCVSKIHSDNVLARPSGLSLNVLIAQEEGECEQYQTNTSRHKNRFQLSRLHKNGHLTCVLRSQGKTIWNNFSSYTLCLWRAEICLCPISGRQRGKGSGYPYGIYMGGLAPNVKKKKVLKETSKMEGGCIHIKLLSPCIHPNHGAGWFLSSKS